ncbi:MAG: LacI family DNA-binding transcriptional regulator [Spirochaetaceae bacterium]|jgi:LacI family transcriptional regulator|nr:LacI family DNA-binding transcriptional regulator [Spirochaetaceae bacterium]
MVAKITDIAREAGVSVSAVSLALNNKRGVSDALRSKILAIAAELDYRDFKRLQETDPGKEMRELRVRFLKIAKHGHIVNERHNPFITEYLEGIEMEASKKNCKVEVAFFEHKEIEDIVQSQENTDADGLIVLGTELNAYEPRHFAKLKTPVVFIDTYFPLASFDCIDIDNSDGVFKALEHFYENGHRSIGLIKSKFETRNFQMREFSFRESMKYFNLPVQEQFILDVDSAYEQATVDMNKHLAGGQKLPTAFFCMNDIIAYACMKALRENGIKIPEDISIIGFDDLPSSNLSEPPLTSIRVSNQQIGQRALEKLLQRIDLSTNKAEKILVSGNLISRDSVRYI